MAWFKVDDGFHSNRKVLSIPRAQRLAAVGLWTLAGSWSAQQELDGFVPDYMVAEWGGTPRLVEALVTAGLWVRVPEGTEFPKWAEYQPTRADLEAARAREAERKRRYRKAMSGRSPVGVPVGQTEGHQRESEYPVPSRPDPTQIDITNVSASLTLVDARANEIDEEVSSWAKAAGIRDFVNLRRIVAGELGVSPDDAALIDAVKSVCRQAKAPVLDVDGYFVAAVRRTPHTVYAALGLSEADAVEARAAVAELLARGGA